MLRPLSPAGTSFLRGLSKSGGGEDVDLFLRIREKNHFRILRPSRARVNHPWWNDGKPI
jgi:hypothetical protein